jgi:hypothetical protein
MKMCYSGGWDEREEVDFGRGGEFMIKVKSRLAGFGGKIKGLLVTMFLAILWWQHNKEKACKNLR